ncbi:uncharacterized protein PRCAT00005032001 [Priceomyces carsonii]|uniref:uncharacterized protein n=1 Tax=Priceomyces carsonii TaxID=28549 RepID=UPI002ED9831E|nr:unnamed protein product [Priceomyces carsonii]
MRNIRFASSYVGSFRNSERQKRKSIDYFMEGDTFPNGNSIVKLEPNRSQPMEYPHVHHSDSPLSLEETNEICRKVMPYTSQPFESSYLLIKPDDTECMEQAQSLNEDYERDDHQNKKEINANEQIVRYEDIDISPSLQLNGYDSWIPGVQLSSEDAYFYHVFLNGFIVAISPQLTHSELTPGAVFVPQGAFSPILREIFYVCGASYLSWKMPDLKEIVQKKYIKCLNDLAKIINSSETDGTEDWMLTSMLLLCLREKFYGAEPYKPATHITMACRIIKKKHQKKKMILEGESFSKDLCVNRLEMNNTCDQIRFYDSPYHESSPQEGPSSLQATQQQDPELLSLSEFYNLNAEGFFNDICAPDLFLNNTKLETSASEKLLMESFIYNYSVILLICDRSVMNFLPSPFELFDEYKYILDATVYKCPVPWMNNPVLGAASLAFEFAAKASWLCFKSPLSEKDMKLARNLNDIALRYMPPSLPENIKKTENEETLKRLGESITVARIVTEASRILLAKILDSNLSQEDEAIQERVLRIYDGLLSLSPLSSVWSICGWPLVVAGMAATLSDHKEYIKSKCFMLSDFLHAQYMTQIVNLLSKAWGEGCNPERGWDLLFDHDSLLRICI